MKQIKLTSGQIVLVDDDWYYVLSMFNWYLESHGYVFRVVGRSKGRKRTRLLMHRIIMNTPIGMETDHIDGNKLNNQRSNLRVVTRQQNQYNVGKRKTNKSGYKGVYIEKRTGHWFSLIKINGKDKYLGTFKTQIEASHAYEEAARRLHGEYYHQEL